MIYITILLFAALVYSVHRRRAQRWERIKRDAAKWECARQVAPLRKLPRVRLAVLTHKWTGETFDLFDDNCDDGRIKSGDWTIQHCNQC